MTDTLPCVVPAEAGIRPLLRPTAARGAEWMLTSVGVTKRKTIETAR